MAMSNFTVEDLHQPQNWWHFSFFAPISTLALGKSIYPGKKWKLAEIRVHFSAAFGSVRDLIIDLSAATGSAYNAKLLSQAMNTVQDLFVHYSDPLLFLSDDHLNISFYQSSSILGGIEVIGWAAIN